MARRSFRSTFGQHRSTLITTEREGRDHNRFTIEFPASVQHGNAYIRVSTSPAYQGNPRYQGSMPTLAYAEAGLFPQGAGPRVMTTPEGSRTDASSWSDSRRVACDGC